MPLGPGLGRMFEFKYSTVILVLLFTCVWSLGNELLQHIVSKM